MNRILMLAIVFLTSFFSAKAQDNEPTLVINAGEIKNLVFGENLKIVLLEHSPASPGVKFSKAVDNKLKVSMHNGMMSVSGQSGFDVSESVYVIVSDIRTLTLGENSRLNTSGVLNSSKIDVFIEQGAIAFLRSTGKVNASSLGDFDVSVERNSVGMAKVF
jgi:hypothetical protein